MDFPGPYCEKLNIKKQDLEEICVSQCEITNGLLLELKSYYGNGRVSLLLKILQSLDDRFASVNQNSLLVKIKRTADIRKKFSSKKKVKGFSSLHDFLDQQFQPPSSITIPSIRSPTSVQDVNVLCEISEIDTQTSRDEISSTQEPLPILPSTLSSTTGHESVSVKNCLDIDAKESNSMQYELMKRKKALEVVNSEIKCASEKLQALQSKVGHFSVKNVNKRDEISRKNLLHLLRDSQRTVRKLTTVVKSLTEACNANNEKIKNLEAVNKDLVNQMKDYKDTKAALKAEEKKKVIAQKSASYYKHSSKHMKELLNSPVQDPVTNEDEEKAREIEALTLEVERLQDLLQNYVKTRNKDGSFVDSIRTCVIELTGLEVANEKVSPVICSVAKHLFSKEFAKGDLPSSKTVQTIVDEGHYVAKAFISEKLASASSWGLNRDGTTRKKQKILDTSITLSSGEVMSLGFTRVSHETAVAINDTTKEHFSELASLQNEIHAETNHQNFIRSSLEKLGYSMSDRAANEKKANELLASWRTTILQQCEDEHEQSEVLNFYCMAHVLLGFHSYSSKEFQEFENHLASEIGPLGRDNFPVFKYWSKKGTVVERVVRTVSDVFGPSGDHHGVRDLSEAHCAENGIKSLIGNYRDNRFNALFQTAAEILVHREDFITVLETVQTPNLKLKAVLADLKCDVIAVLLQCFGLLYVKVTGPYWNLITNSGVPYLYLYRHMTELHGFLDKCINDPAHLLNNVHHWSEDDPSDLSRIPQRNRISHAVFHIHENHRQHLFTAIKTVAKAMKATMDKQLKDFLPGGKFCKPPSKNELARTSFAHVTNLGCEHHFGDLDSSQRRRPRATMHHHSSVQLIKRNRVKMMDWLGEMTPEKRQELLKTARKGGKTLREAHIAKERSVLTELHAEMLQAKNKKRKNKENHQNRRRNRQRPDDSDEPGDSDYENDDHLLEKLPGNDVRVNEYVAVAYDDTWYPGIVMQIKETCVVVKFLDCTKNQGVYQWPRRDDIQDVNVRYILKKGFIPECLNSGRMWGISEFSVIENLYKQYKAVFF